MRLNGIDLGRVLAGAAALARQKDAEEEARERQYRQQLLLKRGEYDHDLAMQELRNSGDLAEAQLRTNATRYGVDRRADIGQLTQALNLLKNSKGTPVRKILPILRRANPEAFGDLSDEEVEGLVIEPESVQAARTKGTEDRLTYDGKRPEIGLRMGIDWSARTGQDPYQTIEGANRLLAGDPVTRPPTVELNPI